jgi:hypothetical protein
MVELHPESQSWPMQPLLGLLLSIHIVFFLLSLEIKRGVQYYYESFKFNVGVWIMEIIDWFMQLVSGRSFENYVEDETLKKTHQMFQSYGFKPIN